MAPPYSRSLDVLMYVLDSYFDRENPYIDAALAYGPIRALD